MKNVILGVSLLISAISNAQEITDSKKPGAIKFSSYFGIGGSQFKASPRAPSDFTSLEFRVGPTVNVPLNSRFEFTSRFLFGGKLKRQAYNKQGQVYTIPPHFLNLDKVASSRNHYFVEVPVLLQFNFPQPKFSLYAGGNYRFFMPNDADVDFLTFRGEFGVLSGINFFVSNKLKIGGEYLFGLTKVYKALTTTEIVNSEITASTRSFQFYVQYKLK